MSTHMRLQTSSGYRSISPISNTRYSGVFVHAHTASSSSQTSRYTTRRASGYNLPRDVCSTTGSTRTSNYNSNKSSTYSTRRNSHRKHLHNVQSHKTFSPSKTFSSFNSSRELSFKPDVDKATTNSHRNQRQSSESFEHRLEKFQASFAALKECFKQFERNGDRDGDSTKVEWKRALDAGVLIERAVDLIRQRPRMSRETFEYSPEGPSPYAYDVPYDTVLVSMPYSVSDDEQ